LRPDAATTTEVELQQDSRKHYENAIAFSNVLGQRYGSGAKGQTISSFTARLLQVICEKNLLVGLTPRRNIEKGVICSFPAKVSHLIGPSYWIGIVAILHETPNSGGDMATFLNVGQMDRALRVGLGTGLGIAGILVNGHPHLGWALGIAGVLVILSGTCGI
jgi:hypothetical protein